MVRHVNDAGRPMEAEIEIVQVELARVTLLVHSPTSVEAGDAAPTRAGHDEASPALLQYRESAAERAARALNVVATYKETHQGLSSSATGIWTCAPPRSSARTGAGRADWLIGLRSVAEAGGERLGIRKDTAEQPQPLHHGGVPLRHVGG